MQKDGFCCKNEVAVAARPRCRFAEWPLHFVPMALLGCTRREKACVCSPAASSRHPIFVDVDVYSDR